MQRSAVIMSEIPTTQQDKQPVTMATWKRSQNDKYTMFEIPCKYENLIALAEFHGKHIITTYTNGECITLTFSIPDMRIKDFITAARKLEKK